MVGAPIAIANNCLVDFINYPLKDNMRLLETQISHKSIPANHYRNTSHFIA